MIWNVHSCVLNVNNSVFGYKCEKSKHLYGAGCKIRIVFTFFSWFLDLRGVSPVYSNMIDSISFYTKCQQPCFPLDFCIVLRSISNIPTAWNYQQVWASVALKIHVFTSALHLNLFQKSTSVRGNQPVRGTQTEAKVYEMFLWSSRVFSHTEKKIKFCNTTAKGVKCME